MSYWLEDANQVWLGDLGTVRGVRAMRRSGPEPLRAFLRAGEAGADLRDRVVEATEGVPALTYIADVLRGAPAPVYLTDGSGQAKAEEEEPEA